MDENKKYLSNVKNEMENNQEFMKRFDKLSWEDTANVVIQLIHCMNTKGSESIYNNFVIHIPMLICTTCGVDNPEFKQHYLNIINTNTKSIEDGMKEILKDWFVCPDPSCEGEMKIKERVEQIHFPQYLLIRCSKENRMKINENFNVGKYGEYELVSMTISNGYHATAYARYDSEWYHFNDETFYLEKPNFYSPQTALVVIYRKTNHIY